MLGRDNTSGNYGYLGMSNRAGFFRGNVEISGNLSVSATKSFAIDHPLDPENRELWHAAIESSEVLDAYSGNTVTNGEGRAVLVVL